MEQGLRLFNVDLPDPIPENAIEMIELAQKIHRDANARRKRISMTYEWDEYWVNAYSAVLIKLKEKTAEEHIRG